MVYLVSEKEVQLYEPKAYVSVDVNENNVTALIDGIAYLFETNIKDITLGYHYRRRSIQERYDKVYGSGSRPARRALRRLKERKVKCPYCGMLVEKRYLAYRISKHHPDKIASS